MKNRSLLLKSLVYSLVLASGALYASDNDAPAEQPVQVSAPATCPCPVATTPTTTALQAPSTDVAEQKEQKEQPEQPATPTTPSRLRVWTLRGAKAGAATVIFYGLARATRKTNPLSNQISRTMEKATGIAIYKLLSALGAPIGSNWSDRPSKLDVANEKRS